MPPIDQIIITSGLRWDFVTQRIHHLTAEFSKISSVVYIEPPRDLIFALRYMVKNKKLYRFSRLEGNVTIISPIIPFKIRKYPQLHNWLEKKFVVAKIKTSLKKLPQKDFTVLFTCDPFHQQYLTEIKHNYSVYDCADNLAELSKNRFPHLEETEADHMRKVDLITATAKLLQKKASVHNKNVIIVPNGCSPKFFEQPYTQINPNRIVIGFVRAVDHWFDVSLIKYILDNTDNTEFMIIGPVNTDLSLIAQHHRVSVLGKKSYETLPHFISSFDICMIPFKVTELTKSVNPIKLYEYLSTGKPILSTALPEVLPLEDIVYIGKTHNEFPSLIQTAVQEHNKTLYEKRISISYNHSWEARANAIIEKIKKDIHK